MTWILPFLGQKLICSVKLQIESVTRVSSVTSLSV